MDICSNMIEFNVKILICCIDYEKIGKILRKKNEEDNGVRKSLYPVALYIEIVVYIKIIIVRISKININK